MAGNKKLPMAGNKKLHMAGNKKLHVYPKLRSFQKNYNGYFIISIYESFDMIFHVLNFFVDL